ncbi:hypothetical protein ABBQ38_009757 [Trebouxia sp. C0009 RCD-2024]
MQMQEGECPRRRVSTAESVHGGQLHRRDYHVRASGDVGQEGQEGPGGASR